MTATPFGPDHPLSRSRLAGFLDHLRDGKLAATRCASCGNTSFPPQADCPRCSCREFSWCVLPGTGTVFSFTEVHAPPAGFEEHAPYCLVLVELDGAGRVIAGGPRGLVERLRIGSRVRVVPVRSGACLGWVVELVADA